MTTSNSSTPAVGNTPEDRAVAEFREIAEQLDADNLRLLLAYMRDLTSGRIVLDGEGSVRVVKRAGLGPLSESDTPNAALFNSILGYSNEGG